MLVDGGAAREIVVRERHILRVEIASLPTRQALNDRKAAGVHDRHRKLSGHNQAAGKGPPRTAPSRSRLGNTLHFFSRLMNAYSIALMHPVNSVVPYTRTFHVCRYSAQIRS
jgi:hypothetical protein